jgi:hypothetical protein
MIGAAILLAAATPAVAQDAGDVGTEVLRALVEQGVVSKEKADDILKKARASAQSRPAAAATPTPAGAIDVTYVPQTVQEKIKQEVKEEVTQQARAEGWVAPNRVPAWVDRIAVTGDFRVRNETQNFDKSNYPSFPDTSAINRAGGVTTASGFPLLNSLVDRNRWNYRARLDVAANISKNVMVDIRVASGGDNSPVSTNTTMGDFFQKDALWIDRAYVKLMPFDGVALTAGRMPNPFYSTDLVWDTDINPEGVALSGRYGSNRLAVFATAGAFPLQERELYFDNYLFAGQMGVDVNPTKAWNFKLAGAWYDFQNMQSRKNAADGSRLNDYTAPKFFSKGNSVFNMRTDGLTTLAGLASDFRLVTLTGETSLMMNGLRYRLSGEFVKNVGMNKNEIAALRAEPGLEPGDTGYQIRFDMGSPKIEQAFDWRLGVAYKYLESDAVLDIFTDSDFGLGGTDVKGYVVEGEMGIYDNTSIGLTWLSSNAIKRPPFAVDVLQVNLNVRF